MTNRQKKLLLEQYQKKLATFATDTDIKTALNCDDSQILKYADLVNYDCFDKLLPNKDFDFRVILVEMKENCGHWCCIVKKNNEIYLFDSYGESIDKELGFISKAKRMLLGEDKMMINRILNRCNCKLNIYENSAQLQSLKPGVSTCGRWVILFIEMVKMGYSLDEFVKFISTSAENENKPTDILVVDWIPIGSDFKSRDEPI